MQKVVAGFGTAVPTQALEFRFWKAVFVRRLKFLDGFLRQRSSKLVVVFRSTVAAGPSPKDCFRSTIKCCKPVRAGIDWYCPVSGSSPICRSNPQWRYCRATGNSVCGNRELSERESCWAITWPSCLAEEGVLHAYYDKPRLARFSPIQKSGGCI